MAATTLNRPMSMFWRMCVNNICFQGQSTTIRTLVMHAMAEWYMRGEHHDQGRLSRILDVAQDLKVWRRINVSHIVNVVKRHHQLGVIQNYHHFREHTMRMLGWSGSRAPLRFFKMALMMHCDFEKRSHNFNSTLCTVVIMLTILDDLLRCSCASSSII